MDTTAGQSRIRWDNQELDQVAARMHQLRAADPKLGLLEAVRKAQACLPEARQREIKTWALMEARLQPKLDALDAQGGVEITSADAEGGLVAGTESFGASVSLPETLPAVVDEPALASVGVVNEAPVVEVLEQPVSAVAEAEAPAAGASEHAEPTRPARAGASVAQSLDPLMAEAAFVAALRSPAVESALVEVFGRAMSKAFARLSERGQASDDSEVAGPKHSQARALLAGFAAPMAKGLEEGIRSLCEVRVWRPNQGPQLLETLVGLCSVAVVPDEMEDEVVNDLRARNLVVLRHSGSAAKLYDRLESVLN